MTPKEEQQHALERVGERQYIYLGPILAPLAHIAVTLYRSAKTQQQKRYILGVGVLGSTVATIGMRLYLMVHAGYPGGPNYQMTSSRERLVTKEEKEMIENPSATTILKEAIRGLVSNGSKLVRDCSSHVSVNIVSYSSGQVMI
jgi:hypothetical protein